MIPIQLDTNKSTFTLADVLLPQALTNAEYAQTQEVAKINVALKADYLTQFSNWAQSVSAGRAPNTNPPIPPNSFVVGHFTDPTNPNAQWPYPQVGQTPICDMPPIPQVVAPPAPLPEPEGIRNVPLGDTMPVGYTFTLGDGAKWQKQSSHTPFGIAYFYLKVA